MTNQTPDTKVWRQTNGSKKPKDRLFTAIITAPILLAGAILTLYFLQGNNEHRVLEITWFTPMYSAFMALTALSVAILSFGRFRVLRDPGSFWIGSAYAGVGIGLLFFVLAWPGLLPNGRSFIASLPNTVGWISPLAASIPCILLLAAVVLPWPNAQRFSDRSMILLSAGWMVFVFLVFVLLVRFERYLPILIREDGVFTPALQTWNSMLTVIFTAGVILSVRHYRRTGDRLIGYVAFFQIAMVFSPLLTVLAGRRYDLWWYLARFILVGGCLTVLFGLLAEYVSLFRQVRESESRYRQLTESLPQLIWTTDADGACNYLSPQWIAYTGIPEEAQLGSGWLNQIHPEDFEGVRETWQASVSSGKRFEIEYRIRRQDGEYLWFITLGLPLYDHSGKITAWFGSCTNIQALKLSETALQQYAEDLERSNRDLQEFAFVASHDLQEPLRKIEAFSDMLLENSDTVTEQQLDVLGRMRNSAGRMRAMVDGMLQLSRLETHAQPFQSVDLSEAVHEVLADLELQVRKNNGVIEVCELPVIEADPLQIRRLFLNLIGNALKFQPAGGQPHVKICFEPNANNFVEILVADNGIGFDESHAGHLFEPFRRLVGRTVYEGSGMGLSICRKIVERHHGAITVSSQPGQGTTFRVSLPVRQTTSRHAIGRGYQNGDKIHVVDR